MYHVRVAGMIKMHDEVKAKYSEDLKDVSDIILAARMTAIYIALGWPNIPFSLISITNDYFVTIGMPGCFVAFALLKDGKEAPLSEAKDFCEKVLKNLGKN